VFLATFFGACSGSTDGQRDRAKRYAPFSYGSAMTDIARRFEILGRAGSAGRLELARYELGEISEQFEQSLPHAAPPREGHPEVLPALESAFLQQSMPELRRALSAHGRATFPTTFARIATACNGCHQASGHGFIEVPTSPGHSIPCTDPLPP